MMMFKDVNSCLQVNVVCVEKGSGSLVEQRDFRFFLTSIRVYLAVSSYSNVLICHACVIIPYT